MTAIAMALCFTGWGGYLEITTPGGLDENSTEAALIGLGMAAAVQKNRKTLFAILGLVFNAAGLMSLVGVLVVGTLMP